MKTFRLSLISLLTITFFMAINLSLSGQAGMSAADKNYESAYSSMALKVSAERIKSGVYYLSKDPLPRRVLNYTLPGHSASTLEEADEWIIKQLSNSGYSPKTERPGFRHSDVIFPSHWHISMLRLQKTLHGLLHIILLPARKDQNILMN